MISKEQTIKEILNQYPQLKDIFEVQGFKGLGNEQILKQLSKMSLEEVLRNKGIGISIFIDMLNEHIDEESIDITLSENSSKKGNINIVGLLPCPVRLPLLERFNELSNISQINHNLKAASEGLDWLKEEVKDANANDLADIYISAGFDLFFEEELMKKYKDQKVFEDFYKDIEYNADFNSDSIQLKDPSGDYSMLAVVPAVFLVNTLVLGDRPMPKTWKDLLNPIYTGSISLPVSDFDLFNAILIHLYQEFGLESVKTLGKQLIKSMHPAEMIKSEKRSRIKPAISIMPYFFTKMALPGSVMKAVWPEDGAIVSPIFMLSRKDKKDQIKEVTDLFMSKETGEILSHKGLFPSVHKDVDNNLTGKTFKWVGWDYINNNDIGSILKSCMDTFNEGMI